MNGEIVVGAETPIRQKLLNFDQEEKGNIGIESTIWIQRVTWLLAWIESRLYRCAKGVIYVLFVGPSITRARREARRGLVYVRT